LAYETKIKARDESMNDKELEKYIATRPSN